MSTNNPKGIAVPNQSISGWQSTEDATNPTSSHLTNTARKDSPMSDSLTYTEDQLRAIVNDPNASSTDKFNASMELEYLKSKKLKQEAAQATDPTIAALYVKAIDPKAPMQERARAVMSYSEARGFGEDIPEDVKLAAIQNADVDVYKAVEALLLTEDIEEPKKNGISQEQLTNLLQQPEFLREVKASMVKRVTEELAEGGWDDPTSLYSNANLPAFPLEGMPPVLRSMVEAVAEKAQVAPDLVAIIALAAVASALVGRIKVSPEEGWNEPVTIFAMGLSVSGSRRRPSSTASTRRSARPRTGCASWSSRSATRL